MSNKKPYKSPEICRVKLNPDQAILAVCNANAPTASLGGATPKCKNTCKRNNRRGACGNNAANS